MKFPNRVHAGMTLGALAFIFGSAGAQVEGRVPPLSAQLCVNCHNQTLAQRQSPDAQLIPLLGGQQEKYLENALLAYARRQRDHFFMRGVAAGLSVDQRAEVVRYFASAPASAARSEAATPMPASAGPCVACHGDSTRPPATEDTPYLSGQHQPYLKAAFIGYAKGLRRHAAMQSMAVDARGEMSMTTADLEAVVRWFSGLPRGLSGE